MDQLLAPADPPWSPNLQRPQTALREVRAPRDLSKNWRRGKREPDKVTGARILGSPGDFAPHNRYRQSGYSPSHRRLIMILSGDDLTAIPPARLAMLRSLEPPTGVAARFDDESLRVGVVELKDRRFVCLLNWQDTPQRLSFSMSPPARAVDVWTGEDLGRLAGPTAVTVDSRAGRLLECTPA